MKPLKEDDIQLAVVWFFIMNDNSYYLLSACDTPLPDAFFDYTTLVWSGTIVSLFLKMRNWYLEKSGAFLELVNHSLWEGRWSRGSTSLGSWVEQESEMSWKSCFSQARELSWEDLCWRTRSGVIGMEEKSKSSWLLLFRDGNYSMREIWELPFWLLHGTVDVSVVNILEN